MAIVTVHGLLFCLQCLTLSIAIIAPVIGMAVIVLTLVAPAVVGGHLPLQLVKIVIASTVQEAAQITGWEISTVIACVTILNVASIQEIAVTLHKHPF